MKKQLKLEILASDIENTEFINWDDCAITRALKRSGHTNWYHDGFAINDGELRIIHEKNNNDLAMLTLRITNMYSRLEKPKDFTTIINYYEH